MNKNFDISMLYNVRNGARIDFAKIHSLNGIYLANQLEAILKKDTPPQQKASFPQQKMEMPLEEDLRQIKLSLKEKSKVQIIDSLSTKNEERRNEKKVSGNIITMLSYDSGASWELMSVNSSYCGTTDTDCFLNLGGRAESQLTKIYSTKESIGIIIGEGNVGNGLSTTGELSSVWMSRDAG